MPTLEELRQRYKQPERQDAPPARFAHPGKVEAKGKSAYKGSKTGRYTIAADGKDVRLHFGRYNGEQVSAILRSGREGRSYAAWMLSPSQDFPKDLLDVVRYLKDEYDKEVAASRAIARSKVRGL